MLSSRNRSRVHVMLLRKSFMLHITCWQPCWLPSFCFSYFLIFLFEVCKCISLCFDTKKYVVLSCKLCCNFSLSFMGFVYFIWLRVVLPLPLLLLLLLLLLQLHHLLHRIHSTLNAFRLQSQMWFFLGFCNRIASVISIILVVLLSSAILSFFYFTVLQKILYITAGRAFFCPFSIHFL